MVQARPTQQHHSHVQKPHARLALAVVAAAPVAGRAFCDLRRDLSSSPALDQLSQFSLALNLLVFSLAAAQPLAPFVNHRHPPASPNGDSCAPRRRPARALTAATSAGIALWARCRQPRRSRVCAAAGRLAPVCSDSDWGGGGAAAGSSGVIAEWAGCILALLRALARRASH
ncbi:hypothetical protein T492DRAFT_891571 [Pavlovales sp. CCMP2436]|nr:hypothetical protein T492DRAFT_891571 [Pavlovales sp. CCMP2436]